MRKAIAFATLVALCSAATPWRPALATDYSDPNQYCAGWIDQTSSEDKTRTKDEKADLRSLLIGDCLNFEKRAAYTLKARQGIVPNQIYEACVRQVAPGRTSDRFPQGFVVLCEDVFLNDPKMAADINTLSIRAVTLSVNASEVRRYWLLEECLSERAKNPGSVCIEK